MLLISLSFFFVWKEGEASFFIIFFHPKIMLNDYRQHRHHESLSGHNLLLIVCLCLTLLQDRFTDWEAVAWLTLTIYTRRQTL